jgi:flagellar basal-body rod protein FlgB
VLDDVAITTLRAAMTGLAARQKVTANNIANVETPGFTASQVDFESSLAQAVSDGNPADFAVSQSATTDAAGQDGNNVSLENEVTTATKTTLQEQLISNALTSNFGLLSTVLKG